jgi:Ser/Thr protein kinase RdoA (MazF antagonist)
VLPTTSAWIGVTYPEDAPRVRDRLAAVAVAAMFTTSSPPVTATPVAHGHIHDTYIVTGRNGQRLVVQRLNRAVFRDIDALASNLERITDRLRQAAAARGDQPIVAEPIATRAGGWMHVDRAGAAWRATSYVEGTRVLGIDATTVELRAAARAFAALTRDLEGVGPLAETIPRFHDLPSRRADLAAAVASDRAGRAAASRDLITEVNRIGDRLEHELATAGAEHLPRRVVHNDAKLNNVLVDTETGAVAAIVDLDTVMYGTVLNDFGELARTAATRAAEDETDLAKVVLELDRFRALAEGYVTGLGTDLAESERRALPLAGPLLTLENAVRFLTDHLNGDVYFRVHHADHNAQRARAQLRLAAQMVDRLDELCEVIAATTPRPS